MNKRMNIQNVNADTTFSIFLISSALHNIIILGLLTMYSWIALIRTPHKVPRYFELKTIFLGFALHSFAMSYPELPLFRTNFVSPEGSK